MSGKHPDQNHAQDIGFIQQHWQLVQMDYLHHRDVVFTLRDFQLLEQMKIHVMGKNSIHR